jgi:2,5-diamino-6-(ribosylamino)-4(3H)-pyrimidinone 5'-phosphate reductase
MATRDALHYPDASRRFLIPYLPLPLPSPDTFEPLSAKPATPYPHVTLTYAQSLDGAIAAAPGVQTALSGPESKAMTHYLRSQHDGILVGIGTAMADDPSLNCRLEGVGGYGGW